MTCPTCSGKTRVIDSDEDRAVPNTRRRRYECWSCETRFSTYEITVAEYEKVQAMRVNTAQIEATIATLRVIKAQFGSGNGKVALTCNNNNNLTQPTLNPTRRTMK